MEEHMWNQTIRMICLKCGSECRIKYITFFQKLVRKVLYCPFCGTRLDEVNIENSVYEKYNENSK